MISPHEQPASRWGLRLASCALAPALILTACTSGGDEDDATPPPDAAAQALAAGLASGEVASVAWTDPEAAAAGFAEVTEGMGTATRSVTATVSEVDPATDTRPASATALLQWTWSLADQSWTYDSTAALSLTPTDSWVATWSPTVIEPSLGAGSVLDFSTLSASRGPITGAGGAGLVVERPVVRFGIDRSQVPPATSVASARKLARLLDVDPAPYAAQVEAAGPLAFVPAVVLRRDDVPVSVAQEYQSIKGALAVRDSMSLGPTADFAVPLLGRVGPVTAEMVEADPEKYAAGDVAGLSGLSARYEDELTGTPGLVVGSIASDGKRRQVFRVDAVDGAPLATTLDENLQLTAERLLTDVGPPAALVAIRPSTGGILAAANSPSAGGVNLATYGRAAPGSTFKTVSTLALLRGGLTADSNVECSVSTVVDGRRFENYDDYPPGGIGSIPLRTALANSCNTAFIDQAGRLSRDDLAASAGSLGLGIDYDLGFPAYLGQVPPATSATEAAANLIGQGKVLASPMAMATVMASIQSGTTVVPRLVESVPVELSADVVPLESDEGATLRDLLRTVVTNGSGSGLLDLPGPPVIAKTGTAEFDKGGRRLLHAWMVAAQDDLAVAVYVDEGASGSRTAGPILEEFLRSAR